MTHQTFFKAARVVDGTGAEPFTADVAVNDGLLTEIGDLKNSAHRVVNADGAMLTPRFIDLNTHSNGQAPRDSSLSRSLQHGVTTVLIGNCGVGFAAVRPDKHERLIRLMEGVEDIPGGALGEGVPLEGESFSQYMDALEALPHAINLGCWVPHDCLGNYAMGERAADDATQGTCEAGMGSSRAA